MKPVGWRGESYRHYLASKGVRTYNSPVVWKEREARKMGMHLVQMSPEEYLKRHPFGTERERERYWDSDERKSLPIEELVRKMREEDIRVSVPFSYKVGGQEGRHRAEAARLAGIKTIPVAVEQPPEQTSEDIQEEFIKRIHAVGGYDDEWRQRFARGRPASYMDARHLKLYAEMLKKRGVEYPPEWDEGKKDEEFFAVKAWPLGRGQQRFIVKRGEVAGMEPVVVNVEERGWVPKSWKSPVTEEEVAKTLETYSPEEFGVGPSEVLLTSVRPGPGGGRLAAQGLMGEAFVNRKVRLYGKPREFELRKMGAGFSGLRVQKLEPKEEELRSYYLYDVLPHEVGHIRLGHTRPRGRGLGPYAEWEAEEFARRWREKRGITEPRMTPFVGRSMEPPKAHQPKQERLTPAYVEYPWVEKPVFDIKVHEKRIGLR